MWKKCTPWLALAGLGLLAWHCACQRRSCGTASPADGPLQRWEGEGGNLPPSAGQTPAAQP
ncbi:hypothetical protein [Chitinolyticbacter meiyuanensis]|uniref:hypothetical protein n=1 Tax=Chitinolyticbacter meiyuanensis TaxID=682798 RepID=UPI0011E58A6D|nr:hypothetical protein [Chitinolyticbacter meiyuanensis]